MAQKLPNELTREILAPILAVPDQIFTDTSVTSPFSLIPQSSSTVLEVCKAWSRVGTPLLYHVVILRSSAQAQALERSLRLNDKLGRLVKKLRVEGGFGTSMRPILCATPNIVDLWLTIDLPSTPTVSGLCSSLLNINPRRVILQNHTWKSNVPTRNLVERLTECFEAWTNMTTISLPWNYDSSVSEDLASALLKSTNLEVIQLPNLYDIPAYVHKLAAIPSLKSINIEKFGFPANDLQDRLRILLGVHTCEKILIKSVQPEGVPSKRSSKRSPNVHDTYPDAARWILPLASAPPQVQDTIWDRILFFAMDISGHEDESSHLGALNASRAKFCHVSRSFDRLARPYLYGCPVFSTIDSLTAFADCLSVSPHLGLHVWSVLFCPTDRDTYDGEGGAALDSIFWDAPRLVRICCLKPPDDEWDDYDDDWFGHEDQEMHAPPLFISWIGFQALATAPIVESRGLKIFAPSQPPCPSILNQFTYLRSLEWDFAVEFTADLTNVSPQSLASLETLILTSQCPSHHM